MADSLLIASGEVALTHHIKVAKMRTLDTTADCTPIIIVISNPSLLCPGLAEPLNHKMFGRTLREKQVAFSEMRISLDVESSFCSKKWVFYSALLTGKMGDEQSFAPRIL